MGIIPMTKSDKVFMATKGQLFASLRHISLFSLMVSLLITGCSTTRKAAKTEHKKALSSKEYTAPVILDELENNHISYQTFSARLKVDFTSGQNSQRGITTFLRMKKDSVIWLSVRPIFGIELARVLITPDSIKLINYLKGTVTIRSADSIQEVLDIPFDFNALQSLIIGNPILLTGKPENITQDSASVSFTCRQKNLISKYVAQTNPFFILENQLTDKKIPSRHAEQWFYDYTQLDNRQFAMGRKINSENSQTTTKINLQYNNVAFDQPLTFPFAYGKHFSIR